MEITAVRILPVDEYKLRAFVSIIFDDCFMVQDIKVIQGADRLFVAMPNKKQKDGNYQDMAHPLDKKTREMVESKILDEYGRELERIGKTGD